MPDFNGELLENTISRRWFLEDCGVGLGAVEVTQLLVGNWAKAADAAGPKPSLFAGKAKNVIFLFMAGAPSHLDLFDNKPQLTKYNGTLPPAELLKGYRAAFINPIPLYWGRSSSSLAMDSVGPSCQNCCLILRRSSMILPL